MGTKQSFVAWSRDRMPSFCEFLCEKTTIVGFPGLLVEPPLWSRQRRENFIQLYLSWGHIVRDQWACHILAHCSEEQFGRHSSTAASDDHQASQASLLVQLSRCLDLYPPFHVIANNLDGHGTIQVQLRIMFTEHCSDSILGHCF